MSLHPTVPPLQPAVASAGAHFEHVVQFYEQDSFLVEAVGRFTGLALAAGDSAVIVATRAHREMLAEELALRGIDVAAAAAEGRYLTLDAAATLAEFMTDDGPDQARFRAVVEPYLRQARAAAKGRGRIAVFGEMVALLWAEGKRQSAIRLEQLWNEVGEQSSFALFCAYPIAAFDRDDHQRMFFNICGEHSLVNPAEGYPAHGSETQRRRSVAELQRKTRALAAEIRFSQERVLLLQNASKSGTWEMDFDDETISLSSKAARMIGFPSGVMPISSLVSQLRHSGDREALLRAFNRLRNGRKEFVTEFRLARNGEVRVFSIRGKTLYNRGESLVLGVLSDITPQHARDVPTDSAA